MEGFLTREEKIELSRNGANRDSIPCPLTGGSILQFFGVLSLGRLDRVGGCPPTKVRGRRVKSGARKGLDVQRVYYTSGVIILLHLRGYHFITPPGLSFYYDPLR